MTYDHWKTTPPDEAGCACMTPGGDPLGNCEQCDPPTREEQEGDAWEYWHQRAHKLEAALRDLIDNVQTGSYESTGQAIDKAEAALRRTCGDNVRLSDDAAGA